MLRPGPEGFIERLAEPGTLPDWISEDEFDHYVEEFRRNGFTGPLNWYRNLRPQLGADGDHAGRHRRRAVAVHRGQRRPDARVHRTPPYAEVVSGDYREVMIDGAGHWIPQERPDEVNEALLDYLSRLEL